jgi:hypothetical protein
MSFSYTATSPLQSWVDELLVAQSDDRIHSHGSAGRDITGGHCNVEQNDGDGITIHGLLR